jgi:dihydroflavonol-4-reductase
MQESVKIAAQQFPELKLKIPKQVPKYLLYTVAALMEFGSKITGKEPKLQRQYIDMFYGLKQDYNIDKSRKEIDFNPKPSKQALIEAMTYLKNEWKDKKIS